MRSEGVGSMGMRERGGGERRLTGGCLCDDECDDSCGKALMMGEACRLRGLRVGCCDDTPTDALFCGKRTNERVMALELR